MSRIGRGFRAALDEACRYVGATAPNPPVGCALLDHTGEILVVAAHHRAGTLHAEARALAEAKEHGLYDRIHTAIVTLEPCAHFGRTPPCSIALRESPAREVWIGAADPNPVATGGAAILAREPGTRIVRWLGSYPALATYRQECDALIAPFARRVTTGCAWMTVKQALDVNGQMIPPFGQVTFTSTESLRLAHRLRRATDAIVTGAGTILADRPRFTVRHVADHPERARRLLVVCDRRGRIDTSTCDALAANGFDLRLTDTLEDVPAMLGAAGVNWAMVEGGPGLVESISNLGLWDDWLTISRRATGSDQISQRARGVSPLDLLLGPEHRYLTDMMGVA